MAAIPVVLIPGGVMPADLAYAALAQALGPEVDARWKDHELYAGDTPPHGWSLDTEVAAIARFADDAGFDRFHLVGYSAGASMSLAFCAAYPERLLSLALNEPPWAGNEGLTEDELAYRAETERVTALPPDEVMRAFVRGYLAPGVEPPAPPPGPPPPWMAKRPAGLAALTGAFATHALDMERLSGFGGPVLFVMCTLTNPMATEPIAARLGKVFHDFTREVFAERHHFDPPHRAEPERMAAVLTTLWARVPAA